MAGDYSIADIATFPWTRWHDMHGQKLEDFPNVERWYNAIDERPGVKRGMKVPRKMETDWSEDKDAWNVMFGSQQYERR